MLQNECDYGKKYLCVTNKNNFDPANRISALVKSVDFTGILHFTTQYTQELHKKRSYTVVFSPRLDNPKYPTGQRTEGGGRD